MIKTLAPLSVLLLAIGCSPDPDEDGLSNREERDLGSNPELADTDGDGLDDGQEVEIGTDPILLDTDEDTYDDGAEFLAGTDPTSAESRIYTGYWPYNPNKDDLPTGEFTGDKVLVGDIFPRHAARDQFRDSLDLYDFAGQGKFTVIDASATWCGPCQNVASWLAGGADPYNLEADYAPVRRKLNRGEYHWVTVMTDGNGDSPTVAEVEQWDAAFPNEKVAVMNDRSQNVLLAINTQDGGYLAWPSYIIVDENMEVVLTGGTGEVVDWLRDNL